MFQRAFSNISLPTHLLLLILVFVIRIPSFDGDYYLPDESQALLIAKKLSASEGHLYLDAWYSRPPLTVWVYDALFQLFGKHTLFVIRLLSCLYLYISAVFFNGFINQFKPLRKMPDLPAILFVILLSVPWYAQEMNQTMLIILPLTIAFYSILQIEGMRKSQNYGLMFQAGFLLTIGILSTFKIAFMMVGVLIAYILLQPVKLDELFSLVGGVVTVLLIITVYMYFKGNLWEFWDQGIMHYLDLIRNPENVAYTFSYQETLISIAWAWGFMIVLAGFGIIHYRLRFYSYVAKIRLVERVLSIWLLFGLLSIGIKWPKFEIQDFILIAPPLAFYVAKMFDLPLIYRFRGIVIILMLLPGVFVHVNYFYPLPQNQLSFLGEGIRSTLLSRAPVNPEEQKQDIMDFVISNYPHGEIWMMEHWPEIYHRLDRNCANKYTDHRLLEDKLNCLGDGQGPLLRISKEPERTTFLHLSAHLPNVVIDPNGEFLEILHRFPTIESSYELVRQGGCDIYALKAPLADNAVQSSD